MKKDKRCLGRFASALFVCIFLLGSFSLNDFGISLKLKRALVIEKTSNDSPFVTIYDPSSSQNLFQPIKSLGPFFLGPVSVFCSRGENLSIRLLSEFFKIHFSHELLHLGVLSSRSHPPTILFVD